MFIGFPVNTENKLTVPKDFSVLRLAVLVYTKINNNLQTQIYVNKSELRIAIHNFVVPIPLVRTF